MIDLAKGLTLRRAKSGIPIIRVHYSADPDRGAEWVASERKKYTSQAAWDREQEIVHEAGAGELVFAHVLNNYADRIIISDPKWQPSPYWRRIGGFDHGKTNPSGGLVGCVDEDGVIYIMREYYSPGEIELHVKNLKELDDFDKVGNVVADPSIFYDTQAQADGTYKAIASIYREYGIDNLCPAPERAELLGMERILMHWRDLENREPTLKIVCTEDWSKKNYGVHNDGCPNLLWELKRTRREKMSAQLLQRKNPTEAIVDKDNHLRDALKYIVLALPEPSELPNAEKLRRLMAAAATPTDAMMTRLKFISQTRSSQTPVFIGGNAKRKQQQFMNLRRKRGPF